MTLNGSGIRSKAWQNPETYEWTKSLTRRACAWEFIRRHPQYKAAWTTIDPSAHINKVTSEAVSQSWGLLPPFEDPNCDAREANVYWSPSICPAVLSVIGISDGQGELAASLASYDCRTTVYVDSNGTQHVLFSKVGRALQLAIRGAPIAVLDRLSADIPRPSKVAATQLRSIKQLADLQTHHDLRPQLYPPHGQGRRLIEILQALDGKLLGASHRDIAVALYGAARVDRYWAGQNRQMRDKVRKTIARGLELMGGGYKQFLR